MTLAFALFIILLGTFVFLVVPLGTHRRRALAVVAFGSLVLISYLAVAEVLGRPKPVSLELLRRQTPKAELVGSMAVENQAIYIWLRLPGTMEPRAYQLPWSEETAKQIRQAQKDAGDQGVEMTKPFQAGWGKNEKVFHPAPQPKTPAKMDETTPQIFPQPSQ